MNLHKNARTCPKSRELMVERVLSGECTVDEVAEQFGVSRRTVHKWLNRFDAFGVAGLEDCPSTPRRIAHALPQDWIDLIVELRKGARWTGKQIATRLNLPRSTVAGVLKREGISKLSQLDPVEPVQRYEHSAPGELIHIDIKKLGRFWRAGHRVTGNRTQDSPGAGWEFVHVCVDDFTRMAYVEILNDERKETAAAFLKRAIAWFKRFGIGVKRVITDNGSCYKSRLWQAVCEQLGVKRKHTRPYRPQTNGKAERLIQTLLREWAYARPYVSSDERGAVLPLYLTHYNEHRGHGSLGDKPPISRVPGVNNVDGIHS